MPFFALFNALRGGATIDRITCAALMALYLAGWWYAALFVLIWFGFMPGWSLALTAGEGPRDWDKKFKPSWWAIKLFGNPKNIFVYGAIGTFVRSICFYPAIFFAHGEPTPVALFFSFGFTFSYFIAGVIARKIPKLLSWNVRIAEVLSACFLWGTL